MAIETRQMTVAEALSWLNGHHKWPEYQQQCLDHWRIHAPDIYPAVAAKFQIGKK